MAVMLLPTGEAVGTGFSGRTAGHFISTARIRSTLHSGPLKLLSAKDTV